MGSISKEANGKWRARYRDPQGRSRSRNFSRKLDAEHFLVSVDHSKLVGSYVDRAAGRTKFEDWAEEWRAGVVHLAPSTLAVQDRYTQKHLLPAFTGVSLAQIDHAMVRNWVAGLTGSGLAPASVRQAAGILRRIMATAVTSGVIPASPCDGIKLPSNEHRVMRFLEPVQIAELTAAMDKRYQGLVLLGAYGGLRASELMGLRAKRVDLLRGRIEVAETVVDIEGHLHFGPPKTRSSRRTVPIPRVVVDALDEHLRSHPAGPDDLVFRSPTGAPLRLTNWRRRAWYPAVKRAALGGLRVHDLRHTAVALWIEAGASPKEVSARAGHTSVSFTFDRYGHLMPSSEDRVNDALDALAAHATQARTSAADLTQI